MPVRLLRRLTGTALRAAIRSLAGRRPRPDAGLKPQPGGKKESPRQEASSVPRHTLLPRGMLPAAQRTDRETSRQPSEPGRGGDPREAGAPQQARISPAKREDARRPPPAASDGQGTRQATVTPAATRDKGEYGGRRGCRGARPSHPLPPAAQATTPRCRAEAAIQREKNFYAQRPRPCGPPFGRSPGGDHARMSGSSRYPAAEKKERKEERKEGRKEENRPPRQASSVSRTTSRMSGSLRISSMS